jgi:hypothetical protein
MFNPFGPRPLSITSDSSYFESAHTKYFQSKSSSGVHEPLCPCNPFSTLQNQTDHLKEKTLLCICTRINAEGMKLLEEINEKVNLSEITLFSANDPEATELQNSPPAVDNVPQEEIVLSEKSPESKQARTPNSEEGRWITHCPKRNARTHTPRNRTVPGNKARVVTMILSREALPITTHYPYSRSYRPWPYSLNAYMDVRWDPQKKANQIHAKPVGTNDR